MTTDNYQKFLQIKISISNCDDYKALDAFIEEVKREYCEYPCPEFLDILKCAKKRRDELYDAWYLSTVDINY